MKRKAIMFLAGEPSGDLVAAELVRALEPKLVNREFVLTEDPQPLHATLEPSFFGAGGQHMAGAGVKLDVDMTQHAVVGLWEVVKKYRQFRRIFHQLFSLALQRQPDAIICVDFSGFNLRFGHAIRNYVRSLRHTFANWEPRIIQYVAPQVWASRPDRAQILAKDFDLLLSILPFEKASYAKRAPRLRVEFVGHPLIERYGPGRSETKASERPPMVLLLPGSREAEVQRHLPVMLQALGRIRSRKAGLRSRVVLPNESLASISRTLSTSPQVEIQVGGLAEALSEADVAIASTGTVTLECAIFGVPTVALYKTSPATYWIGKQLVRVEFLAMPNLLARERVIPEFIQDAATAEHLAAAALEFLDSPARRQAVKAKLAEIVQSLGLPGASERAADAIARLLESTPTPLRAALND